MFRSHMNYFLDVQVPYELFLDVQVPYELFFGCSGSIPLGWMGAGWNVPVFGYWAHLDDLDDKTQYPTVARVVESAGSVSDAMKTFLHYQNWTRVGIIGI